MDRCHERRERLRPILRDGEVEGLLVASATNVGYLTGFTGDSSVLVLGREKDVLVSDGRFTTQLEQECPGLEVSIRPTGTELHRAVASVVEAMKWKQVAFEATACTVAEAQALSHALPSVSLVGVSGWVEELRRVKDDEEIAAIRAMVQCAEQAFLATRAGICGEDSEKDVADTLDWAMRRGGSRDSSFPTIVAIGRRSALPHARPTRTSRIRDSDFVLIDWGASGEPYKSDLTRVVVTGKVTPEFERIYRVVLAAQERAIAAIRPGARCHDVDAAARSVIDQAGYGGFFSHGVGHGIGRDIHEAPRIRKDSPDVLEPGNVVTVEPGIYLPDWGGIRIEDDVLVTPTGCEVLSRLPKSLETVAIG